MDKTQADAIAHAILEPDLRAQEDLRHKRAAEAASLARRRRVAWFTLAGCGIGAVIAYFAETRVTQGVLLGGVMGTLSGWLLTHRAA